MERKNLSNSMKHHSIGGRSSMKDNNNININTNHNNKRAKDSWVEYSSSSSEIYGEDLLSGFPWPPRSYTCSFCKREFRSAQALGGHMNVHRRERARLRQSPPRDGQYPFPHLNLNSNPNPSFNHDYPSSSQSPSPPTRFPPFITPTILPPFVTSSLSSPSFASPSEIKKWVMGSAPCHHLSNKGADFTKMKASKTVLGLGESQGFRLNNGEIVRLDLEIGLVSDSKEDLDLELRLGRS